MDAICERCGARVSGPVCDLCGGTRLVAAPVPPTLEPSATTGPVAPPASSAGVPAFAALSAPSPPPRSAVDDGANDPSTPAPTPARSPRRGLIVGAAAAGAALLAAAVWQLQAQSTGSPAGSSEPAAVVPTTSTETTAGAARPSMGTCDVSRARITASSTAPDGIDATGRTVSYAVENLTDGDTSTAWRAPGTAIGESIEFEFDQPCRVSTIRLLNGYHKVDSADKADRWKQNRRLSLIEIRAGESVVTVDLDAGSRRWQRVPLDAPNVSRITLLILGSRPSTSERDYTAVSEIQTV